jgi:hypothetical protein
MIVRIAVLLGIGYFKHKPNKRLKQKREAMAGFKKQGSKNSLTGFPRVVGYSQKFGSSLRAGQTEKNTGGRRLHRRG